MAYYEGFIEAVRLFEVFGQKKNKQLKIKKLKEC
jgi:hypothetical protein